MSSCSRATFGVLGSERVPGSRLDTGRRPLQGSLVSEDLSRVRLWPVSVPFGNRYIGREDGWGQSLMTIPQSDHNAALSPDRPETDLIASSKDPEGVSPKFICWSSFISTPDVVHCLSAQFKVWDFKGGKVYNEFLFKISNWATMHGDTVQLCSTAASPPLRIIQLSLLIFISFAPRRLNQLIE